MTNDKIIQFDNSDLNVLDTAISQLGRGKVDVALGNLFYLYNKGSRLVEVYAQIALGLMKIGCYEQAVFFWNKVLFHAPKIEYARAYNGLGECYFNLGETEIAAFNFDKQLEYTQVGCNLFDETLFEVLDAFYEQMEKYSLNPKGKRPVIKICHDEKGNAEGEQYVKKATRLMEFGEVERACKYFESVKSTSKYYKIAQMNAVSCHMHQDRYSRGKEILQDLLQKYPNDGLVLDSFLFYAHSFGETVDMQNCIDQLAKIETTDFATQVARADTYFRVGEYESAIFMAESALKTQPFNTVALILLGASLVADYKFEKANKVYKKLYRLTNTEFAKFYSRYTQNLIDGTDVFSEIKTEHSLPIKHLIKRSEIVESIIAGDKKVLKKLSKTEVLDICAWMFEKPNDFTLEFTDQAILIKNAQVRQFFIEKLMDYSTSVELKECIVQNLVLMGFNKRIGVLKSGIFQKVTLQKAEFDRQGRDLFEQAYALAVAKLLFMPDGDILRIRDSAYSVYYTLVENDCIKKVTDVKALSAVIVKNTGCIDYLGTKRLSEYFGVSVKKVESVLKLLY